VAQSLVQRPPLAVSASHALVPRYLVGGFVGRLVGFFVDYEVILC
jgi:hypothetical protein